MRSRMPLPGQLALDLRGSPVDKLDWHTARYGPPVAAHDPRCWLDPLHHTETPCSWPADPQLARTLEYERVLRLTCSAGDPA